MTKQTEVNIGGSIFWIGALLVSLAGLILLSIWSFQNNSVKGIAISFIFFAMITSGIIFSKFEIFNSGTWSENSLSFMLGLVLYLFIGGAGKSVLAVSQNNLFSSISSELPQFLEMIMNNFVIPISEETFWMIGIPFAIIGMMNIIGKSKKASFAKNTFFQMFVVILVSGASFAAFHVGKYLMGFLVAAFIFRMLMVLTVVGDQKFDWLPFIRVVPAFAVGAHIGNNWGDSGFVNGLQLLTSNNIIGWGVLLLIVVIALSAVNQIVLYFMGDKSGVLQ